MFKNFWQFDKEWSLFIQLLNFRNDKKSNQSKCGKFYLLIQNMVDDETEQLIMNDLSIRLKIRTS